MNNIIPLSMNLTLYNLIGYLLLPVMVLRLIFKGANYRKRMGERLGFIEAITADVIWVHCVSVGEFRAAIVLIDALMLQYPNHKILVTSTTLTGSKAVIRHYKDKVLHLYFLFDVFGIVKRYIKKVNPKICLLLETEIWPNLIHALHKNGVPTLLVNARLSKKSLAKYQKFPKFSKQILNKLSLIATQNQNSAERFKQLGADKVKVTGNIKFDQNPSVDSSISQQLKTLVGNRKVVVFASTHKGEEMQIMDAYLKNPLDALMLIVPRHPERFDEVYKLAEKHNLKITKRSDNIPCNDCTILLGDSMGEMMAYFEIADIVFMGGSLSNTGGHNMLEPAALSKPIVFGPNVFNFSEISTGLIEQNASIQVQNADELLVEISALLANEKQTKTLGKNANQYFKSQQGAVDNLIEGISVILN
ncbi:MAG: 3-deoxy-D-manno-octulosonic acid transferase [Catillopecten margaritatus gill symbiont]|uniref:3-deoxy-D-manno-octulosonic acid transferase n=1 Tax=Catillopecten margaritatus gill symbiont TaxID=3083288 RepID=A0AAU6PID6_9GAMM